jgi:hypothetical protein
MNCNPDLFTPIVDRRRHVPCEVSISHVGSDNMRPEWLLSFRRVWSELTNGPIVTLRAFIIFRLIDWLAPASWAWSSYPPERLFLVGLTLTLFGD